MPRLRVPPTRSNLIRVRQTLALAREGHTLLDRKREVLTLNLIRTAHDAEQVQQEVERKLSVAYEALRMANLVMGREKVQWVSLATEGQSEVRTLPRSLMGVVVPTVELARQPPDLAFGLGDTEAALDGALVAFREVLASLPTLVETVTAVWRLATELQRTQRRVNALEHILIPQYQETVKFIEESLEEKDREDYFRLKRVKALTAKRDLPKGDRSGPHV